MNDKKNYGVITEQGFAAGQFGFGALNEQDNAKIAEKQNDAKNEDQK